MKFNKNWTKQEKSIDYIREYFGNDKLFYHPKKKYYQSGKSAANMENEIFFIYLYSYYIILKFSTNEYRNHKL